MCTISELPVEMLEIIFDYLTLKDLKPASMVCNCWNDIIFNRKPLSKINLIYDESSDNFELQVEVIKNSNRKYPNIFFGYYDCDSTPTMRKLTEALGESVKCVTLCNDFTKIEDIFYILSCTPNLSELHISQEAIYYDEIPKTLPSWQKLRTFSTEIYNSSDTVQLFSHLKKIAPNIENIKTVEDITTTPEITCEFLKFYSKSLKKLSLVVYERLTMEMLCQIEFPSIVDLCLEYSKENYSEFLIIPAFNEFLRQFTKLKSLTLKLRLTERELATICSTAKELEIFEFDDTGLQKNEISSHLAKLKNIKTLKICQQPAE